jgi:predicted ATPase with chaperone activity
MAVDQRPHSLSDPRRLKRTRSGCRRCDHNVLLLGPPGAGTSRLARRRTTILPAMSLPEAIDTIPVASWASLGPRARVAPPTTLSRRWG